MIQIQELYRKGEGIRAIARTLGISRATVRKYKEGDPSVLCRSIQRSSLASYTGYIIQCIKDGMISSQIADDLSRMGYDKGRSNAIQYIHRIAESYELEKARYKSCMSGGHGPAYDHITRKGIFNHLWMNMSLTAENHGYLWERYPVLRELEACIREFREIFDKKNMPMLYLFIDKYKDSKIKELSSFASGLEKDLDAVENAVASDLSNGFVEGVNNKVKMIKRTMYGRCRRELLEAKLMCKVG